MEKIETEATLCEEYQAWVDQQGFPQFSADELILHDLTPEQRKYVSEFIKRWNRVVYGEEK